MLFNKRSLSRKLLVWTLPSLGVMEKKFNAIKQ